MPPTRTKKERFLLAYLAIHAGTPVYRDRLASALWPDSTESQALANLRRSLVNLRSVLGSAGECLSLGAGPVQLNRDGVYVDVLEFDRLVERGTPKDLKQAISLYRGPFLPECRDEWAVSERLDRVATCTKAIHELVKGLPTLEATHYLSLAITIEPLNEEALRQLMSTYARFGDTDRALEQYRNQEATLRAQFGWIPSPETTALYDRIRSDSLQPRRTSDRRAPDRIFGRANELAKLKTSLRIDQVISIVGPPGVGKSRLARALVEEVTHDFADGFLRIDLEGESLERDINEFLCSKWSLEGTTPPRDRIREFLARREVLLWVDGAELLPADVGRELADIAYSCHRAQVLITSWQPLGLPGEQVFRLEPLGLRTDPLENLQPSDSAQLFEHRARIVWPSFTLTRESTPIVERLCSLLDGLPLAIELAATWTNTLPLEDICAMFEGSQGQESISTGSETMRRRSLGTAIDIVIETLNESEFAILCAVNAFPDGCSIHALRSILSIPEGELLSAVRQTVSRSLLTYDGPSKRYRLLRAVKDRCSYRQSLDGLHSWIDRAGSYLWGLVEAGLNNGDTLFDNYADDWLLAERENYRYFVERWKSTDLYRSIVTEFAMVAYQVWHASDVALWLGRFRPDFEFPGDSEPFVRYVIAIFALWQGHSESRRLLEESAERCRKSGASLWEAASWSGLSALAEYGSHYLEQARLEQIVQNVLEPLNLKYYPEHSKALQASREYVCGMDEGLVKLQTQLEEGTREGDWRKRYASLRGLGGIAFERKEYEKLSIWGIELAVLSEKYAKHELTNTLRWQVIAAIGCGDYAAAKGFAEKSVQVARQRQTHDRQGTARMLLAEVAEKLEDWDEADRQLTLAGQIFESISVDRALCVCVIRRAIIARNLGRRDEFRRLAIWAKSLQATRNFVLLAPYKQLLEEM